MCFHEEPPTDPQATESWSRPEEASSSSIDFSTVLSVERKPAPDHTKSSREAIKAVMEQVADLYSRLVPMLRRTNPLTATAVAKELLAIHDQMGRVKIGLLPRSTTM